MGSNQVLVHHQQPERDVESTCEARFNTHSENIMLATQNISPGSEYEQNKSNLFRLEFFSICYNKKESAPRRTGELSSSSPLFVARNAIFYPKTNAFIIAQKRKHNNNICYVTN
jgi:hypothetical protein